MSFGGGGQQPVTTTQSSSPWAGAQPHLQDLMGNAQSYFSHGTGYVPYSGPTQATLNPAVSMAEAMGSGMSQANLGGTPNNLAAQGLAGNMIQNQGMTPGLWGTLDTARGLGQNVTQYYNMYNEAAGNQNPYLLDVIGANDRRIADKVNSSMSGSGRYGSGAHTDVLARSLAEAANPILAQDYQNRQQNRFQALQGAGATNQAMADIQAGGLNRAGQFAQLAPALDETQYAGVNRLMGLGQQATARDQAALDSQIQLYNAQQAYPWEQLARYSGIVGGMGGLGGTTVKSSPSNQVSTGQRALGGAIGGAGIGSMFGPVGAGIGALGGGLLGFL